MKYFLRCKISLVFLICAWGVSPSLAWGHSGEVQIENVEVHGLLNTPVVLLAVGDTRIPIFVDPTVANSIQGALKGQKLPRPFSHELMQTILKTYEIHVERVSITLENGIFYGTITLSQNGRQQVFDSRSSDAIALAVHFESPIFVEEGLLESVGKNSNDLESEVKKKGRDLTPRYDSH